MKKNKYFIWIIIIIQINSMFSQEVTINNFHGKPVIKYPIATAQSGSLTLPVMLVYSPEDIWESGGVSNEEWDGKGWPYNEGGYIYSRENSNKIPVNPTAFHPGNFGIGWSLFAGGKITRSIVDIPDEAYGDINNLTPNGGYYKRFGNMYAGDKFDDTRHLIDLKDLVGKYDVGSDKFSFNFNGISGYFYYHWGNWIVVSESNISLEVYTTTSYEINDITITTADGVKYTFGGSGAKEYTEFTNNSTTNCVTGWGLTKIESPKGEIITLAYDKETVFYPQLNQCTISSIKYDPNSGIDVNGLSFSFIDKSPSDDELKSFSEGYNTENLILKSITSDKNYILFNKSDCDPFLYANTNSSSYLFSKINQINITEGAKEYYYDLNYNRTSETLFLTSIQKSVSYNSKISALPETEFEYYNSEALIAPTALKRMKYPTGAISEFEYEQGDFERYNINFIDQFQHNFCSDIVGRYRILSHKLKSNINDKATLYKYKYGKSDIDTYSFEEVPGIINDHSVRERIFSCGSFYSQLDNKPMSFYTKIQNTLYGIILDGESKLTHRPASEIIYTDVCEEVYSEKENQTYSFQGATWYSYNGYYGNTGKTNDQFLIGKIARTVTFDKNLNLYNAHEYYYKAAKEESIFLKNCMNLNFKIETHNGTQVSTKQIFPVSSVYFTKYLLDQVLVFDGIPIQYQYMYNNSNKISQKEIVENKLTINSDETNQNLCNSIVNYKYIDEFDIPDENGETSGNSSIIDIGIKNLPVEIIYKKNNKITGAEFIKYKRLPSTNRTFHGFYVPYKIYSLRLSTPIDESEYIPVSTDFIILDSRYELVKTFEKYDDFGNVLQYTEEGKPATSIKYTQISGSWLPVIKAENCISDILENFSSDDINLLRGNNPQ